MFFTVGTWTAADQSNWPASAFSRWVTSFRCSSFSLQALFTPGHSSQPLLTYCPSCDFPSFLVIQCSSFWFSLYSMFFFRQMLSLQPVLRAFNSSPTSASCSFQLFQLLLSSISSIKPRGLLAPGSIRDSWQPYWKQSEKQFTNLSTFPSFWSVGSFAKDLLMKSKSNLPFP